MKPSQNDGQESSPSPEPPAETEARGFFFKTCAVVLGLLLLVAMALTLILYRVYGTDTNHASRDSIWWNGRCRGLTPPAATDITLQRDFLDHIATYTISEADLNAFLDDYFAFKRKTIDSFSERRPVKPTLIGTSLDRLDWVVTKDTVVYHYSASNGSVSSFYHDPTTGMTYQSSAHW